MDRFGGDHSGIYSSNFQKDTTGLKGHKNANVSFYLFSNFHSDSCILVAQNRSLYIKKRPKLPFLAIHFYFCIISPTLKNLGKSGFHQPSLFWAWKEYHMHGRAIRHRENRSKFPWIACGWCMGIIHRRSTILMIWLRLTGWIPSTSPWSMATRPA